MQMQAVRVGWTQELDVYGGKSLMNFNTRVYWLSIQDYADNRNNNNVLLTTIHTMNTL